MSILEWIFVAWLCLTPICLFLSRAGQKGGEALLEAAVSLEQAGEYEEACFRYAVAASRGYQEMCRAKIRDLWEAHGPFDFSAQLQKLRSEYCSRCTSCGEGYYHLIVSDIHRWVRE